MDYWNVKIPQEGDLTREQGWASLERLEIQLGIIMSRLRASPWFRDCEDSPLSDEERSDFRALHSRLKKLTERVKRGVLEQLADLSEEDDTPQRSYGAPKKYPRKLRELLDDFHGDIERFDDPRLLALALLEHKCNFEPSDIQDLIQTRWKPDDKMYGDVWTCPQCDDWELGFVNHEECTRCMGWGYVFGESIPDDQYDWSEKGRQALNSGEEWTAEMEEAEQARLRAEDTCYKCEEQMPCDCNV